MQLKKTILRYMITLRNKLTFLVLFTTSAIIAQQKYMVDKVVAVIGESIVLQSDVEQQSMMYRQQGMNIDRCELFENFLVQKLLVNQARIDSIEIPSSTVEMQLNNQLDYYIQRAGSREKLEEYYNRSLAQIKEDMRGPLKEQLIMQRMQNEITDEAKVTPSEVKDFYNSLPPDSIPLVNLQYEYKQIIVYPPYAEQSVYEAKQLLLNIRKRILDGENFATLAVIYSQDNESAVNGGEIGFMSKGQLDPEYAKAAFGLKEGAVSGIVETQYGYHIIQLIKRDGEKVNTRHILIKPKPSEKEIKAAMNRLDSILNIINKDSITFEKAAYYFSEDKNSRLSYGQVINPQTNSTKFEVDEIPQSDFYILKSLKVGEVSKPFPGKDSENKDAYKIVKLVSVTNPHKANLNDDYQLIQNMAIGLKKRKILDEWIEEKLKSTSLLIDSSYKDCNFRYKGWKKNNN
mgnify:CR=1 FL=1